MVYLGDLDSNLPTREALPPSLHTRLGRRGWRRFGRGTGSNLENRSPNNLKILLSFWGKSQHQIRHVDTVQIYLWPFCCLFVAFWFLIPIFQIKKRLQDFSRLGNSSILAARALRQRPATPSPTLLGSLSKDVTRSHVDDSKNKGTSKWMVYNEKPY